MLFVNHQEQSSKTTKKFEFSFASQHNISLEARTLIRKPFVNAKSSIVAFNKQEQKKKKKEVKTKMKKNVAGFKNIPSKIEEDKEETDETVKNGRTNGQMHIKDFSKQSLDRVAESK